MKINQNKLGDVGIRLKPDEPDLLKNYTELRRRTRKKRKKKKKKNKKTVKSIEIHRKRDPLLEIVEQNINKKKTEEKEKEEKEEKVKPEIKKVKVEKKPQDLSETDPNVKKLVITASTEPDQKKKGTQIKLE